jgi:Ca2+-binding RTX toxin-like protein
MVVSEGMETSMQRFGILILRLSLGVILLALALVHFGEPRSALAADDCGGRPPTITSSARTVEGTSGDDVIVSTGTGYVEVRAGFGNDKICIRRASSYLVEGGHGNDLIYIESNGGGVIYGDSRAANLAASHVGHDTIYGGPGIDTIYGGYGNDSLFGMDGNDSIYGGPGDDYINGANGDDIVRGESGNDTLFGSVGYDQLIGGPGKDKLWDTSPTSWFDAGLWGGRGSDDDDACNGFSVNPLHGCDSTLVVQP